ncbi:MAG TPA: valine--tRNA ligase, partial [Rikenellaceae bacterium]|nr:valine--tRNA ligase [Rikenellaceae bacterium]
AKLKEMGITKEQIGREEFLKHAWEWKEEHGGIILQQLRKLGCSCDWDRTRFTMEPELSKAVINTFVYFYKKGWIYKGVRMVNWDPEALTAVSDDEVIHKDTPSHFYHLKYYISDGQGNPTDKYLVIATTRPETIMADAAICVNPADERHHWLRGKKVLIPLINREIPVIEDSYVEMDFGTGCLKVTPAHDVHDYEIGLRHNLPVLEIIDDHGKLNEKAQILVGEDRFVARKKIVKMLEEAGNLLKVEDYTSPIGYSERTNAVIEPKLSAQWFLKMEELAKMALETVESGRTNFVPEKYVNTYRHWMENARDWCISRQLWWGQRIPAYYLPDGTYVVESTPEEALKAAQAKNPNIKAEDLRQDEDVLDTWFSSWLWPISVFDPEKPGHPEHQPNKDLAYYYPTNDLVTGPDIIFFWVARMIMAGEEFMGKEPFSNVYFTGIVRDKIGRKMSKTLGNSPNPLDLIETYGADAVRIGMLLCSSAGNDIFYDEAQIKQGAAFCNKIWNSYRLIKGFQVADVPQTDAQKVAIEWFRAKLSESVALVEDHYSKFRISDALMTIYKLFWDEYCSWYLEAIKPAFGQPIDAGTQQATLNFFEALLKLIHPVMPFITEELWQDIAERKEGETIMYAASPKAETFDGKVLENFTLAAEAVNGVRGVRSQRNIAPKENLTLKIKGNEFPESVIPVVEKLAGVTVERVAEFGDAQGVGFMVRTIEMFIALEGLVNVAEELAKARKDLEYQQKFLAGVRAKLSNEKFTAHAPAQVIENERKKEADALSKIESLEAKIAQLSK